MPTWSEYRAHAKERGSLAFELYCVISEPTGDVALLQSTLPDHLAYQKEREAAGDLVFAGPLSDETGEQMMGMGMILYRAEGFEAARALAEADPMHAAGARTFTLRRWMINEGSIGINVKLSGQRVALT